MVPRRTSPTIGNGTSSVPRNRDQAARPRGLIVTRASGSPEPLSDFVAGVATCLAYPIKRGERMHRTTLVPRSRWLALVVALVATLAAARSQSALAQEPLTPIVTIPVGEFRQV